MSNIVVNPAVNNHKPSMLNSFNKHLTIRGIFNTFNTINGVLSVNDAELEIETLKEFGLTKILVLEALAYAVLYPQILEA